MKHIKVRLSQDSIRQAISELKAYKAELDEKMAIVCRKLAERGLEVVKAAYGNVDYLGDRSITYEVMEKEPGRVYAVQARGKAVLYLEFGAGAKYGYGHPEAGLHGRGPGTYPPTNPQHPYWDDPNGWWINGQHTYGNPPSKGMYDARFRIIAEIKEVMAEVFG